MKANRDEMPGVSFDMDWQGKHYIGTAEALAAAGLLTLDQLPGLPGMPSTATTYVNGIRLPRTARPVHDESYKRIFKMGAAKFRVTLGFNDEERARRERAEEEDREADARIKHDPGYSAAHEAVRDASALFKVGDSVTVWGGAAAVITQGFGIHSVKEKEGEYLLDNGTRGSYRPGYVVQFRNGETFFAAAWKVMDADEAQTHLRLVGGSSVRAQQPMMALRG
ncbi:hypothetical protein RCH10_003794 [Variovorax sp. GrIS 2.14]|uniref:hypothetical protein n=1 Tax=Variovorax sp. GrIS 2.14 TaxID=3071709 RepID=UPI0038F7B873